MIVDTLSGSGRYDALHPRFKKAFDYAVARMDTLAPGKYAIDGDDLYIVISEGLLRPEQEAPLERTIDTSTYRSRSGFGAKSGSDGVRANGVFCPGANSTKRPILFFSTISLRAMCRCIRGIRRFFPGRRARPADRQRQCPESDPEDPGCVRAGVRYSKRRTIACFFCLR